MISYTGIKINGDYNVLKGNNPITGERLIKENYIDDDVVDSFCKYFGNEILRIIIEWPYYDQEYLSTYYIHYAKKFSNFPKYCYRLHFIARKGIYCGYTILRPIIYGKKLGKTYIDPALFINETAYLMLGKYKVHMRGFEYIIRAFPWMMQDTDITICAHIAMWTVLNYYGNKYMNYVSPVIGSVVENVSENWGRKTPSIGLTPIQVSEALSRFGFYPIIRGGTRSRITQLLDETMAYIESGIPVIAMSESRQHAFSIIGHGEINKSCLDNEAFINKSREPKTNFILHSKLIDTVYAMDDNWFPYRQISRNADSTTDVPYSIYEISYVIVPLYSRMQLEYHEVYYRFIGLAKYSDMNWTGIRIIRIYITSSNSLKRYMKNQEGISPELRKIVLGLNMSKFVWCIDTSEIGEYKAGKVSGKVIIDTTAGTKDTEPWILLHDKEKIKYYDVADDKIETISGLTIEPYGQYIHNLKVVKPGEE